MSDSIDRRHLPTVAGFRFFKPQHVPGSTLTTQLTFIEPMLNAWAGTSRFAGQLEERSHPAPLPRHDFRQCNAQRAWHLGRPR